MKRGQANEEDECAQRREAQGAAPLSAFSRRASAHRLGAGRFAFRRLLMSTFSPVNARSLLLVWIFAWGSAASADDWTLLRFEGRDYVTLDNVATFYGLPAPPPIDPADALPSATISTAPPPAPSQTGESEILPAAFQPTGGKVISLDNGKYQLAVTINSREAQVNGVKQWLAFPTHFQDGKLLISRLDLSKTIEPRLRPEKTPNLKPVTTVVLDPGHGGHDKGAASRYGFEKDFSLDVALRARELLEKEGVKVVMTRSADIFIPLHQRPAVANRIEDSIFVSIHFNATSSNPNARGFEIYSVAPRGAPATNDALFTLRDLRDEPGNVVDQQSTVLAGTIFHSMLGHVPMEDRGLKHARFAVLRLCTRPAVLIELGFVSNAAESALIGSSAWRQKVAEAIVTGVEGYKNLAEQKQAPKVLAEYRRAQ
jgi:N-acetylmuramoyl-L-alanine amidase